MVSSTEFASMSIPDKAWQLYKHGTFIIGIRYYRYKINLYLYGSEYLEVFYNHKHDFVEKIEVLDTSHTRMKFYEDQIKLSV